MNSSLQMWRSFLGMFTVLGTIVFADFARAELPPEVYNNMRADAPEALIIQVTDVKQMPQAGGIVVEIKARVLSVEKSGANVNVGDTITIRYTRMATGIGFVGPRPIPILKKEQVYPAFLSKQENHFTPAARGGSFVMVPPKLGR